MIYSPNAPDVGIGLGLPGLEPGIADVKQIEAAVVASDKEAVDEQLLRAAVLESESRESEDVLLAEAIRASRESAAYENEAYDEQIVRATMLEFESRESEEAIQEALLTHAIHASLKED